MSANSRFMQRAKGMLAPVWKLLRLAIFWYGLINYVGIPIFIVALWGVAAVFAPHHIESVNLQWRVTSDAWLALGALGLSVLILWLVGALGVFP